MADLPDEATPQLLGALCQHTIELLGAAPSPVQHIRVQAGDIEIEMSWPGAPAPAVPASVLQPAVMAGVPAQAMMAGVPAQAMMAGGAALLAEPVTGVSVDPPAAEPHRHYVCAPTVGTFYRRPEPGARPFVEVGDVVDTGHQVAILEAMKLMNAVEADLAGRIVAILVEDGASVEHGQPLIALEPAMA